ncbi:MAG: hypothetical protein KKA10_00070 [Euryarchaeota archaeon]|nr:hypothetical protein [Euryarchaeota archaeon]MBU4454307.1 hypothetical protein [Euryarchaeota archaeon]MCG2736833.1 hypothetical protein [Candidatus Methanoperedenaceae archaeon]
MTLKEKFVSLADQLRTAAEKNDYQGGRRIISQMKDTVTSFRTETKLLIAGNEAGARDALNSALEANSDYFDSLVTEAREARKNRNLEFFDLALARAQGRLDKAKEKGVDVSALQVKLDEISNLRSAFVDAMNEGIAACDGEGIGKCTKPEVEAFKTVREEIKGIVDSAETKYKAGDFTGAQQDLKKAQEMFKNIRSKAVTRRNTR